MAGNGFKSPAPVLPAMGLHSFHNDSPPFAAASEHHDPEHLSLDAAVQRHGQNGPLRQETDSGDGTRNANATTTTNTNTSTATTTVSEISSPPSAPMPITQRGFAPTSMTNIYPLSSHPEWEAVSGPHKTPGALEDEVLSTSRSRRLVSGYLFGNPPSPHDSVPSSPTRRNGGDGGIIGVSPRQSTPSTPSQAYDSPDLSRSSPAPVVLGSDPHLSLAQIRIQDGPGGPGGQESGSGTGVSGKSGGVRVTGEKSTSKPMDRRKETTGYEALLNGLNDGEADLDESAPQAAFSTENYMKGVEGPAGEYQFPSHRLRRAMKDESKIPLVIVACGSFSPPTYLHLRMFEMAKDEIVESQTYEIMAGYYSPVSSYYKKSGLAPAIHRVRMCELAVEHTSTWLMVDPWEAGQPEYSRTAVVLEHFNEMLNVQGGGLVMSDGKKRKYKVMLLAGGDLIESFGEPGVWSEPDLHIILGRFGCLIVERAGSDVWAFLLSHDILYHHRRNVIVIKQLIYNDISSTKVRLFVRRGMSIKYLLPNSVIQYIYDNKLYRGPDSKAITR